MKIYEVLWEEIEYGYDVAMLPPLVFTTKEAAEKAAKALGHKYDNYFVRETELLETVPDDVADREIGCTSGCAGTREEAIRELNGRIRKWKKEHGK